MSIGESALHVQNTLGPLYLRMAGGLNLFRPCIFPLKCMLSFFYSTITNSSQIIISTTIGLIDDHVES